MSSNNDCINCIENDFNEETAQELSAEKTAKDCNFWELITDVAKDLDLALQDLSPDLEISSDILNGVIGENAGNGSVGREDPNPLLLESIAIGITGNDSKQSEKQSKQNSINDYNGFFAELSPDKTSSTFQTDSCALLPTFTAHSKSIPVVKTPKPSYSSQLLLAMDSINISDNSVTLSNSNPNQIESNDKPIEPEVENIFNNSVDILAQNDKNEDNSGASCESIPAHIGLLERLIRCHPIWFLPDIGRAGVVHLLQGKETGCFIVRQSSKANTMALSVRLPEGRGPHIEHYLIEDGGNGKLHLEGSENYFSAIPMLVCHYCNCCDELPVQLTLPKVLSQSNRQQLTSLALLGQDFWQSSLSKLTSFSDTKSDDNSSASDSLHRPLNSCSTFKSDTQSQPPPIPPKQDISSVDPLIDTKKSSTVAITQQIPKLPPKRPDPPPVPPRTIKPSTNNNQSIPLSSISKTSMPSSDANNRSNDGSVDESAVELIAPNTEMTLIQLNDGSKCRRHSSHSSVSNSSQTTDEIIPKKRTNSATNAQKKVWCYRSSVHDKDSDYEDIWGAKTVSRLTLDSTLEGITENNCSIDKCHKSSQTVMSSSVKDSFSRQTSSPFYTEPIDAIPRPTVTLSKSSVFRRSDTDINDLKPLNPSLFGHSMESLMDNMKTLSSQINTCKQTMSAIHPNLQDVSLQVGCSTFVGHTCKEVRESSWPLDESWQWLDDNLSSLCNRPFKRDSLSLCRRSSFVESMKSDITTVEDMIEIQAPELTVPKVTNRLTHELIDSLDEENNRLRERYDNLANYRNSCHNTTKQEVINDNTDNNTEFSEPWDSEWWEGMVKKVFPRNALLEFSPQSEENHFLLNRGLMSDTFDNSSTLTSLSDSRITSTFDITEVSSIADIRSTASSVHRESTASDRLTVLESNDCGIGLNICNYIFKLSAEGNNTFAKAIDHFITCTQESTEINPFVVMRNIRQFMNGMKNYLVKHGEGQLAQMVEQERTKLKANEFLNIDAILESALHRLVIKPLKQFLYQLFINECNKNGSLRVLSRNIKEAQTKSAQELGVREELLPIDEKTIHEIQRHLHRLQQSYSPLKKLEYLLSSISCIYNSVRKHQKIRSTNESNTHSKPEYASFGAEDFLPIFVYVLIQCGVISAEIEADYMTGLLHSSILNGEGGYYLTTLSSAVHVLKNIHELNTTLNTTNSSNASTINTDSILVPQMNSSSSETSVTSVSIGQHSPYTQIKLPTIADLKVTMKFLIPDELTSNIVTKTLPVRPNMTAKEVSKMISNKFKITNNEDFGLFKVINGEEIQLNETDLPQVIKTEMTARGQGCQFAYKRYDAKFIWPLSAL